jgi:hypothetical protein
MKKQVLIALGMAIFGLPFVAAAAGNFSGSWLRDNSKSDPAPNGMYWLTREPNSGGAAGGGRAGRGGRGPQIVMTVEQTGNSLKVTQESTGAVETYALDGKPFTRKTDTGIQKETITAGLQGNNLVISTTQPWGGMPGNVPLEIKQTWSMSPDGKTLTITTMRADPAEHMSYKQVYTKQ